jgi:mRNA-degrading endonuclease HigB of HigAB toxin-antitoxin module
MDYTEKIENEELFALCLKTLSDDEYDYCIAGREYKIIDYIEDEDDKCFIIEDETNEELQFAIDDSDFEIIERE